MNKEEELIMLVKRGTPYLRSVMAFIIFLRYEHGQKQSVGVAPYYEAADEFLRQLKKDVEAQRQQREREQ